MAVAGTGVCENEMLPPTKEADLPFTVRMGTLQFHFFLHVSHFLSASLCVCYFRSVSLLYFLLLFL